MTKADKFLIAILLVAALAGVILHLSLFKSGRESYAQISVDGKVVKTFSLREGFYEKIVIGDKNENNPEKGNISKNKIVNSIDTNSTRGYNIIEIKGTHVHMHKASCPDQICVKSGWISFAPQQIVCLPNRVVIEIISDGRQGQIDSIAR